MNALRVAFSSWLSVFGIVAGAFTAFNIARRIFGFGLGALLKPIIDIYEAYLQGPLDAALDYLFSWTGVDVPNWVSDALVAYAIVGGVVFRVFVPLLISNVIRNVTQQGLSWFEELAGAARLMFGYILFWPAFVVSEWKNPYIFAVRIRGGRAKKQRTYFELWSTRVGPQEVPESQTYEYVADMRLVYLVQLAMLLTAGATFLVLNFSF